MLEAIVSLRRRRHGDMAIGNRETRAKQSGDIVAVKIAPAIWGRKERKHFLIVKLVDLPLQTEMEAAGQTRRIHPYARIVDGEMLSRCRRKVDLSDFTGTNALDPDVEEGAVDREGKPRLTKADLLFNDEDRTLDEVVVG